jgi:hypothetical protein
VRAVDADELQVEGTTIGELAGFAHFFHVPLHHLGEVRSPPITSPRRGRRAGGGTPVRGSVAH